MLRSLWGAPRRVDSEGGDPAEGCGVAPVVDRVDHCAYMAEQPIDVGKPLPLQGREHRDMSVVGEHVEDDPRPYGATLWLVAIGRDGYIESRCARLLRPGYPGDGGEARVVVEKVVECSVHRNEDSNDVAWRGRHIGWGRGGVLKEDEGKSVQCCLYPNLVPIVLATAT